MPGSDPQVRFDRLFILGVRFLAPIVALTVIVFATGCGKSSSPAAASAPQAMPVQVHVVQSQEIADSSEYLSIFLKSRHSATINPQVEGQITKIFVKSGDRVKAGTPILQIDPLKQQATVSSQEANRAAQEANMRYAQTQLERARKLYEAGVVSKQEFDNAQTAHDAAVAQLKSLSEQVSLATGGITLLSRSGSHGRDHRRHSGTRRRPRGRNHAAYHRL